jgi:hypothetical protein
MNNIGMEDKLIMNKEGHWWVEINLLKELNQKYYRINLIKTMMM